MSHIPYHDAETDAELIASLRWANDDMAAQIADLKRANENLNEHWQCQGRIAAAAGNNAVIWQAVARDLMRKSGAPEAEIEGRLRLAYAGVAE